jgi:3-isopropylmalate dehydrogenase
LQTYQIATLEGDGIGPEVCQAAVAVLKAATSQTQLQFEQLPGGANHYLRTGHVLDDDTFAACKNAHAILHGAAGLPHATYPDGTEVGNDLHLQLRFKLDLYANVRPIKLYDPAFSPLKDLKPGSIDYVIVRENTEGLYASRGGGTVLRDSVATDTLVMTRHGIERIAKFALDLCGTRPGAPKDQTHRLTICDKANILRSYAFFRAVCQDVAKQYPDVTLDYAYVDAITVHMVKRPSHFDVIVAENMFGDIISDLGAGTVGGLGLAPSAEIGDNHALFQGAHGSAPDIAGQNVASPLATILSGAFMLRWLGQRHGDDSLLESALRIEAAVEDALKDPSAVPADLGGKASCTAVTDAICRRLA